MARDPYKAIWDQMSSDFDACMLGFRVQKASMDRLQGDVSRLQTSVNGLQSTVAEMKSTVDEMKSTVDEMKSTVDEMTGTVRELKLSAAGQARNFQRIGKSLRKMSRMSQERFKSIEDRLEDREAG